MSAFSTLARALTWPIRLADLETQACQIVGDEFCDRLRSPGTGLHPAPWLRALAEEDRGGVARGPSPSALMTGRSFGRCCAGWP